MDKGLKGKRILVLGAANGIGRSLALDLARRKADLFLLDIDKKLTVFCQRLNRYTRCQGYVCDLADHAQVADRLVFLLAKGGLDGIVYVVRGRQKYPYSDLDEKKWKKDLGLTVEAILYIIQRLWKEKKINSYASIVLLSSVLSQYAGAESISYHMSKSALESMCRYLTVEMGIHHIRTNILQLGHFVKDEFKERFYSKENTAYRFWLERVQPLRRVGHNVDAVGPITFLLSDQSAFMTGQTMCVDGGLTIQEPSKLVRDFLLEPRVKLDGKK